VGVNLIALAIPLFLVFIGVELAVAWRRRVQPYRLLDALVDLSCGVTQQTVNLFFAAGLLALYTFVYDHRLVGFAASSPWPWLIAFVGVDFFYYWWHRLSHEVNFLWAAHVVHHSSEDYNLAVALRQGVFTNLTSWPFYFPLALLGVPPLVFVVMQSLSTLYQF
jgi:alkylglycerol monooxygenase